MFSNQPLGFQTIFKSVTYHQQLSVLLSCVLIITGTLMSSAWKEPKCRIGLILGTTTGHRQAQGKGHVS